MLALVQPGRSMHSPRSSPKGAMVRKNHPSSASAIAELLVSASGAAGLRLAARTSGARGPSAAWSRRGLRGSRCGPGQQSPKPTVRPRIFPRRSCTDTRQWPKISPSERKRRIGFGDEATGAISDRQGVPHRPDTTRRDDAPGHVETESPGPRPRSTAPTAMRAVYNVSSSVYTPPHWRSAA